MGRLRRPARFFEVDGGIAGFCGPFRLRAHARAIRRSLRQAARWNDPRQTAVLCHGDAVWRGCDRLAGGKPRRAADENRRQPRPSVQPRRHERLRAGFGPESLRSGSCADGHEVWRNPDVGGVSGQRAGHRGGDERRQRRGFSHSHRNCHFADASRSDSVATGAFSAGQVAPVGAGCRRRRARGREARLWQLPQHRLSPGEADVILSLDSDFLGSGPGHIRYAREFSRRRKLNDPNDTMNRLYVVEPTPSVTGATADHRLPLRASEVELFARALAARVRLVTKLDRLAVALNAAVPPPGSEKWLDAVAKDLGEHRGKCLVVAGDHQPASLHTLVHEINSALDNVGTTLYYTEPVEAHPVNNLESLRELCTDVHDGKVETLLIFGVNPVYTAPHDFDFASKIRFDEAKKRKPIKNTIYVGSHFDETAELCDWHVAESHYLETWGDARAFD